jgi:hypothetical protein
VDEKTILAGHFEATRSRFAALGGPRSSYTTRRSSPTRGTTREPSARCTRALSAGQRTGVRRFARFAAS